jgi:hypothetical protein
MAVTLEQLALYVYSQDTYPNAAAEAFATTALATAEAMVKKYLCGGIAPDSVRDTAVLQVASEIQIRKDSPAGFRQISDGSTGRLSLDPMKSSYAALKPWRKRARSM